MPVPKEEITRGLRDEVGRSGGSICLASQGSAAQMLARIGSLIGEV